MDKRIATYLLDKYLKGDCSPAEEEQVVEWYNSFKDSDDWISAASETEKQEIKYRIYNSIAANPQNPDLPEVSFSKNKTNYLFYTVSGIAASLMIYFGLRLTQNANTKSSPSTSGIILISNNTKSIIEQTLSDGTHVWLSPGAQLKYSKVFTGNTRQVSMSGESFFEVTKNPAKPFIINSGKIITKVWGTSFRVRDIKGSSIADVAVVTGKVSVKAANPVKQNNTVNEVMLYPNQQVVYNQNDLKTNKQVSIRELKIWKKINLSFDNTALKQVVTILDKNFGVNISIANNTIKAYTLNADFNGLNLPEILEILHKTLNVRYEIAGENVSLEN